MWSWILETTLDTPPKSGSIKEKSLTSLKAKNSALPKALLRELKDKPQRGRKYFQNTYLVNDLYSKYAKIS